MGYHVENDFKSHNLNLPSTFINIIWEENLVYVEKQKLFYYICKLIYFFHCHYQIPEDIKEINGLQSNGTDKAKHTNSLKLIDKLVCEIKSEGGWGSNGI